MDRTTAQGQAFETIAAAQYDDRATIRRRVTTKSSSGGNVVNDEIVAENVPVKIKPSSAQEKEIAGATEASVAYTVRMPAWQNSEPIKLTSPCFLDIAARGDVEAHTLSVVAPLPSSGAKLDAVAIEQT